MIIAFDFDGTLVENAWPEIGDPKQEYIDAAKELKQAGHYIILWTCREDDKQKEAVKYLKEKHNLVFNAVNDNMPFMTKQFGTNCRKIYADHYVDDKGTFDVESILMKAGSRKESSLLFKNVTGEDLLRRFL